MPTTAASVLEEIGTLAAGFSGTLGVWARSFDSGGVIEWQPHETFPAASTIKLADLRFYHDNEASVLLPKVSAVVYQYFAAERG